MPSTGILAFENNPSFRDEQRQKPCTEQTKSTVLPAPHACQPAFTTSTGNSNLGTGEEDSTFDLPPKANPTESDAMTSHPDSNLRHFSIDSGQTVDEAFRYTLQISYGHLTAVPASGHVDQNPSKARFYLMYPWNARAELEYLQQFLRSYTFQTNIFTSMENGGWDAFQNSYRDYIGVILVLQFPPSRSGQQLTSLAPRRLHKL